MLYLSNYGGGEGEAATCLSLIRRRWYSITRLKAMISPTAAPTNTPIRVKLISVFLVFLISISVGAKQRIEDDIDFFQLWEAGSTLGGFLAEITQKWVEVVMFTFLWISLLDQKMINDLALKIQVNLTILSFLLAN